MNESTEELYRYLRQRISNAARSVEPHPASVGQLTYGEFWWDHNARFGKIEAIREKLYWRPAHGDEAGYPIELTNLDADTAWAKVLHGIPPEEFKKDYTP